MRSVRFLLVAAALSLAVHAAAARADDDELAPPTGGDRVPKLVEALLGADSFKVRATAAVALRRLAGPRAAPALAAAHRADGHYAVRVAVASALGRLPTPEGIPPLLEALHDTDPFVREEARGALELFHNARSVFA